MRRIGDIIAAGLGLLLLSPILVLVAIMIWRQLGSPIFFRQTRPGRGSKPFRMIKFRTMRDAVDAEGNLLSDSERLTPQGHFLRSSSLDMSLIGPRPLLMEYLPLYSPEQARRHEMRPGITGWAQVNGRNAISWDEKFALDIWYIDNHSVPLDLKIIWLTIRKVLKREGISAAHETTMPKFKGSES